MTGPVSSGGGGGGLAPSLPAGPLPPNLATTADTGIMRGQPELADPGDRSRDNAPMDWKTLIGVMGATLGMGPRRGETTGQLLARAMSNGLMTQQMQRTSAQQRRDADRKASQDDRRVGVLEKQVGIADRREDTQARVADATIASTMARIGLIADQRIGVQLENQAKAIARITDPVKQQLALRKLNAEIERAEAQTEALTEKPGQARSKAWTEVLKSSVGFDGRPDPDMITMGSSAIPGLTPMSPAEDKAFRAKFARETAGMNPDQIRAAKLRAIQAAFDRGVRISGW